MKVADSIFTIWSNNSVLFCFAFLWTRISRSRHKLNIHVFLTWWTYSLLKVQRMIFVGSQELEYYMNNRFVFKADRYNAAHEKLNKIDQHLLYNRRMVKCNFISLSLKILNIWLTNLIWSDFSQMNVEEYTDNASLGMKTFLVKEKLDNLPKVKAFYTKLFYLDIFTKTLFTYWIVKKCLAHFDVIVYWFLRQFLGKIILTYFK